MSKSLVTRFWGGLCVDSPGPITLLSLFSGVGGLDLGVHAALRGLGLLGRTVAYLEGESYAVAALAARMEEQVLDAAPVWDNVSTFDGVPWRGLVDGVIGGFPCQDLSLAGKGEGLDGNKSGLFFQLARIVRDVRPGFVFLENVPGLAFRGLGRVLGELAGLGFDAEWDVFSAEEEGAPHRRERLFILAYRSGKHLRHEPERLSGRRKRGFRGKGQAKPGDHGPERALANADSQGQLQPRQLRRPVRRWPGHRGRSKPVANTKGQGLSSIIGKIRGEAQLSGPPMCGRWASEPDVARVAHGVPDRLDRVRALGNAVVPACAERAFLELWERAMRETL